MHEFYIILVICSDTCTPLQNSRYCNCNSENAKFSSVNQPAARLSAPTRWCWHHFVDEHRDLNKACNVDDNDDKETSLLRKWIPVVSPKTQESWLWRTELSLPALNRRTRQRPRWPQKASHRRLKSDVYRPTQASSSLTTYWTMSQRTDGDIDQLQQKYLARCQSRERVTWNCPGTALQICSLKIKTVAYHP